MAVAFALAPENTSAQNVLPRAVVQARRSCDGDTISVIEIRTHPPSYSGLVQQTRRSLTTGLGITHLPTRPAVIAAYMRLSSGSLCTAIDQSESERLLRAQPFVASATIQAIPDGPRRVRLRVNVVDEPRLVIGASMRHGTLSSVSLGNENVSGRGLSFAAGARRGFAYRDGFGAQATKYGMFGRPDFLTVAAERRPVIGERLMVELAEPFLTDLQLRAYHASASLTSGYAALMRPAGENVSLFVRRTAYDASWVTRVGRGSGRNAVGLIGAVVLGEDVRTGNDLVIVADSGLAPLGANPFATTYPAFTTTRVAGIGGVRALRFITVNGFDAVTAEQDMGIGVQMDVLAGPSVQASAGESDMFVAGDFYSGVGNGTSFLVARALAEARKSLSTRRWDGVVMSGRLSWYGRPSEERSRKLSVEFAGLQRLAFPMQLTLRDAEGGVPGMGKSQAAGGKRFVVRAEERRLLDLTFGGRADLAVGVFAAAGKLWAGDVPYGQTTPYRASAGLSLIGAYPTGGKRTFRLDIAVPVNREPGGSGVEFRFSASDRTRVMWLEPNDVARARTGAVPVSLMKW